MCCQEQLDRKIAAGESAGLRIPLAGLNSAGQHHHLSHALLVRAERGRRKGRGRKAEEEWGASLMSYEGNDAAQHLQTLHYPEGYDDDGYVLSSADALTEPKPIGTVCSKFVPKMDA